MIRAVIALVFAVPAAMAGYHAALGLAQLGVPAELWQRAFALIGAVAVGTTAWARLALPNPPDNRRRPYDRLLVSSAATRICPSGECSLPKNQVPV